MPALLTELEQHAHARGLDLFGVVDAHQFDKTQPPESRCAGHLPGCGTAVVVGCGGKNHADAAALHELLQVLRRAGVRARLVPDRRSRLNVACLGEAAGFGIVSPVIHRLLHPRYGPWIQVHGVLLVEGQPFGPIADASIAASFHPCCTCSRPCVQACPSGVHDGRGSSRLDRCHDHRRQGGCGDSCSVVRTCPVGADQRAPAEVELVRHRRDAAQLARRHGRGLLWALRRAIGI